MGNEGRLSEANELSSPDWLLRLGFRGNPFFLEPIPPDPVTIKGSFIDREAETEKVRRFADLKAGRLLVLGRTGEGKSSLLNVAEALAAPNKVLCVRIDGSLSSGLDRMLEALLSQLQKCLEQLDNKKRSELAATVKELDVVEVRKEERDKFRGTVEAGLGSIIATLKSTIGVDSETGETVVYRPKDIIRNERILQNILHSLFEQLRVLLVFDNTEKLPEEEFRNAVKAFDLLPRNVLCIVTADYEQIGTPTMNLCYKVFDYLCSMSTVDDAAIGKFIDGRMKSFTIAGSPKTEFASDALKGLFERTRGNLRETFRYCYRALESCADTTEHLITRRMVLRAIADTDAPRFSALDETDRALLSVIVRSGKSTIDVLEKELSSMEEVGTQRTIRRRLEALKESGLLQRTTIKRKRTYATEDKMPKVLIEAIQEGNLLKGQT